MSQGGATLERRLLTGTAVGIAIYVVFAVLADLGEVAESLASFRWIMFAAALALAGMNYVLRWVRWELYLKALDVHVPRDRSVYAFLGGFAMTISPGKVGEVLKSYLLKRSDGISLARTAPIVIAERATDVVALLVMVMLGLHQFTQRTSGALELSIPIPWIVAALGAMTVAGLAVLSHRRTMHALLGLTARVPRIGKHAEAMLRAYDAMEVLLRPRMLVMGVLLATAAWALEGVGLYLILLGFDGGQVEPLGTGFAYAFTTLVGAFSFLPGGLGVTEGAMGLLLERFGYVAHTGAAFAATYLIRLATLWFAVLIGVAALVVYRRRYLDDHEIHFDELQAGVQRGVVPDSETGDDATAR